MFCFLFFIIIFIFLVVFLLFFYAFFFFFFNDTATTEIYTLSLHDALPIAARPWLRWYWSASRSCVTLLTPYGDSGLSGVASSSRRAPPSGLPYSSAEPTTTTRGMGFCLTTAASRLASSPALVAIVSAWSSQDAAGLLSAARWKTHCGSISRTRLSTRSRSRRSTWWVRTCGASSARGAGRFPRMVPCTLWRRRKRRSERWLPAKPSIPVTRTVLAVLRLHHLEPLDTRFGGEQVGLVGPFPRKVDVGAAKVAVGCRLLVDRAAKLELPDDLQRAEVEVLLHQMLDLRHRHALRPERLHEDRDRLAHTDRIGDLDLAMAREPGGDDVLGDIARGVGARTVDLRGVFPAEAAAAVPGIAPVAVDDDLAAGHPRVSPGPAQHEAARRVHVDGRAPVEHLGRNHLLEHEFPQILADPRQVDVLGVLRREHHGIDAHRPAVDVLDRHLRLAVGPQVGQGLVFADARQLTRQLMRQLDRHRHQLRRLVAGKAEHHALVAGAAGVDALRDVGRLLLDGDDDATGFGIEAESGMVITGLLDGVANHIAHLDIGVGGDLADDERQSR